MTDETALSEAAQLAAPFEGLVLRPYRDPGNGVWTIGYGSTRDAEGNPVTAGMTPITQDQALAMFERDLRAALSAVENDVTVPLTDEQEAALTSFVYNVGVGAFAKSTLLRLLNRGDLSAAASQFDLWVHAGGKVLAGLVRRRAAERKLFEGEQK